MRLLSPQPSQSPQGFCFVVATAQTSTWNIDPATPPPVHGRPPGHSNVSRSFTNEWHGVLK